MNKLEMSGVKSDAINQRFGGFGRVVFSVADDGVADGSKLCPDLILQTCPQLNPDERRIGELAFDGVAKFGTGGVRVFLRA